jgi:hypothetical protein
MASLLGALVGSTVHSTVIEKLHFRHFWMLLAMVYAMAGEDPARGRVGAAAPEGRGLRPASRARLMAELEGTRSHG